MAYIPQIVAFNDGDLRTNHQTFCLFAPIIISGGTGYVSGDVGKVVTINTSALSSMTTITPATLVIKTVVGGHVTAFDDVIFFGDYLVDDSAGSGPVPPWSVTGATTGSGLQVWAQLIATPSLFSPDAGLSSSFTSLTISLWASAQLITIGSPTYAAISLSPDIMIVVLKNASGVLLYDGLFPFPMVNYPQTTGLDHYLLSFDTTTNQFLFYNNDVQVIDLNNTGGSGPWVPSVIDRNVYNGASASPWIIQGSDNETGGMASLYVAQGFTDFTIEANRRLFINADLTSTDPAGLPAAATNMYLKKGDQPVAIADDYGGTGIWTFPNPDFNFYYGFAANLSSFPRFAFVGAAQYQFTTISETDPVMGSLFGSLNAAVEGQYTLTTRPGASLTYALTGAAALAGTVVLNSDGTFVYTPTNLGEDGGQYSTDIFGYTVTETMPDGYVQPFGFMPIPMVDGDAPERGPLGPFTASSTVVINFAPTSWLITSRYNAPGEGAVGNVWIDQSYVDFSDPTVRANFINPDGSWIDLGNQGQLPTGTSPLNFLTVSPGADPTDILYGYGQNGGQSSWVLLDLGTDPTTELPYPDMSFDACSPEVVVQQKQAVTMVN